jgi:hypothetical protein
MIIGGLASAGGGLSAGTLGTWTAQWGMSTPPVFRAGVGLWGSLDVWGGSLVGTSIHSLLLSLSGVLIYCLHDHHHQLLFTA